MPSVLKVEETEEGQGPGLMLCLLGNTLGFFESIMLQNISILPQRMRLLLFFMLLFLRLLLEVP